MESLQVEKTEVRFITNDAVPFVDCHILQQADVGDAGIVDEDVDTVKALCNVGKEVFYILIIGDIADACENIDGVFGFKLSLKLKQLLLGFRTGDDDVAACAGKGGGDGTADSTGGAGDQSGFSFHNFF